MPKNAAGFTRKERIQGVFFHSTHGGVHKAQKKGKDPAELKTVEKAHCQIIASPPPFTKEALATLPIETNKAYVLSGNQLFFVNKKKKKGSVVASFNEAQLKEFNERVKVADKAVNLSPDEQKAITEITGHFPSKYEKGWYLKAEANKKVARHEVVAQEFLRLLIPRQPKTRLVIDEPEGPLYYVASQEVAKASTVPQRYPNALLSEKHRDEYPEEKAWNAALKDGSCVGLGEIAVGSFFVNEVDLKYSNLFINAQGQVVKIDGDSCFPELTQITDHEKIDETTGYGFTNEITSEEIALLPFPGNYYASNWLGFVTNGVRARSQHWPLNPDLSEFAPFRAEVNHTLLKILILPDELIKQFVSSYLDKDNPDKVILEKYIIERKKQFRAAALNNQSFCAYLRKPGTEQQLKEYIEYLKFFVTTENNNLWEKVRPQIGTLEEIIKNNFQALQESAPLVEEKELSVGQVEDPKKQANSNNLEELLKNQLNNSSAADQPKKPSTEFTVFPSDWSLLKKILISIIAVSLFPISLSYLAYKYHKHLKNKEEAFSSGAGSKGSGIKILEFNKEAEALRDAANAAPQGERFDTPAEPRTDHSLTASEENNPSSPSRNLKGP